MAHEGHEASTGSRLTAAGYRVPVDVRFRDIDALGHVNNAVYLTYFEIARNDYLITLRRKPLQVHRIDIVVAEAFCRYKSPALYGEQLLIEIGPVSLRSRSFELIYRVTARESSRLIATGKTLQFAIDRSTLRATNIDAETCALLQQDIEGYRVRDSNP